jgi:pimeloyl-ACP methyl ester carboxylesterase
MKVTSKGDLKIMGQEDEFRLAYGLRRSGPESIVFIPGLGASKSTFDTCFELASFRDYTLAAIDLPGCGDSGGLDNFSYRIKDQADLVLKWIKDLGLDHINLVGHSMGGVISLYLAAALGKRVKKFFNLEGNLSREDCFFSGKIASFPKEVFERQGLQQFKKSIREALQEYPSPGLKNWYENISKASPQALYLSSLSLVKEACKGNLKEKFHNLSTKKWYVFGERSLNRSTRTFLDANNIPYFIVPESGHFMMGDQPGIFYRMLFEALGHEG